MIAHAHFDGAARLDIKLIGIGIVLTFSPLHRINISFPMEVSRGDNNHAEYAALLVLLKKARENGCEELTACSDSEILVKQITGEYRCMSHLAGIREECLYLIKQFKTFKIVRVPRGENGEANALAQSALNRKKNKGAHV